MLRLKRTFLVSLLLTNIAIAEESQLVGEWRLVESSFPLSKPCHEAVFRFTKEGLLIANDGSFVETKSFKATPHKSGFLIETHYISNNGKNNCQGIPATQVKANTVQTIYVEVLQKKVRLKMYFGPKETEGFIVLEKRV